MKLSHLLPLVLFLVCCSKEGEVPVDEPISVVLEDVTVAEGNSLGNIEVEVSIKGTISTNVVVSFTTSALDAKAGIDYEEIRDQQLIFSDNTPQKMSIPIIGDQYEERDEKFSLTGFSRNMVFDAKTITITLENDDENIADLSLPGGKQSAESYPGMELVWEDEFQQAELDAEAWNFELGDGCPSLCQWGNSELQSYQKENVFFKDDDFLVIQARQEGLDNFYTSARITTKNKKTFQYGRVDIRALCPEGKGIWPALWMLGANIDQVSWPASGEIDIMELVGDHPNRVHGTVHYGDSFESRRSKGVAETLPLGRKFSEEFHVFSLIWEEDKIEILLDDEVYNTITPADVGNQAYPFNQEFYFLFNVAVGGTWPGNPNSSTVFPQYLVVDYIRVFQKS